MPARITADAGKEGGRAVALSATRRRVPDSTVDLLTVDGDKAPAGIGRVDLNPAGGCPTVVFDRSG